LLLLIVVENEPDLRLAIGAAATLASALLYQLGPRWHAVPAILTAGVALNLLAAPLSDPTRDVTPRWSFDACTTLMGDVGRGRRHIGIYAVDNVIDAKVSPVRGRLPCLLPGNSGLLFGRPFVNGYSPVLPSGFHEILGMSVHGDLEPDAAHRLLGPWSEPGSLLDRWGVEFITIPDLPKRLKELEQSGWRRNAEQAGAWLLSKLRSEPLPLIEGIVPGATAATVGETASQLAANRGHEWVYTRAAKATRFATPASLVLTHSSEIRIEADVSTAPGEEPALVLVRRAFFPGYEATLSGAPLRLGRADGVFVAVEVPAGRSGKLVIEYRPLGVRAGGVVAFTLGAFGLLLCLWVAHGARLLRGRRHSNGLG
jgi:hypothetical protein